MLKSKKTHRDIVRQHRSLSLNEHLQLNKMKNKTVYISFFFVKTCHLRQWKTCKILLKRSKKVLNSILGWTVKLRETLLKCYITKSLKLIENQI